MPLDSYATKTNRKRLANAYSEKFAPMQGLPYPRGSGISADLLLGKDAFGSYRRCSGKATRNTQGVAVMTQRKGHRLLNVEPFKEDMLKKPARYRTKSLPAMGSMPAPEETQGEQMKLS